MPAPRDWTRGPAKWAAVTVLGTASLACAAWSMLGRDHSVPFNTHPRPESSAGAVPSSRPAPARLIDLNTASIAELELLPGVGPAMAARIVEYRQKIGRFTSIEQLDSVRGIGARTMERLRPLVKVGAPRSDGPSMPR